MGGIITPASTSLAPSGVTPGSYTNADITVNADGIVTAANSGVGTVVSGGVALPYSHINKKVQVTSNTALTITALYLTAVNSSGASMVLSNVNQPIATGTSGAGGLDTGALAASTWYYGYIVATSAGAMSAVISLVSPLTGGPTMPSGYTYWAYAGAVRTDSSKNLYRTLQLGSDVTYVLTASTNTSTYPALISATTAVGNISTPVWQAVSVSTAVPAFASAISILVAILCLSAQGDMAVSPNAQGGGYLSTTNPASISIGNPYPTNLQTVTGTYILTLESSNIYVAATASNGAEVFAKGWREPI